MSWWNVEFIKIKVVYVVSEKNVIEFFYIGMVGFRVEVMCFVCLWNIFICKRINKL